MLYKNNNKNKLLIVNKCIDKNIDINSEVYFDQECFNNTFDLISFNSNPFNSYECNQFINIIGKYKFIYAYQYSDEILVFLIKNKFKYKYKLFIHELEKLKIEKFDLSKVDRISSWSPLKLTNIFQNMDEKIKDKLFWINQGIRLTKNARDRLSRFNEVESSESTRYIVSVGDVNRDHYSVIKAVSGLDIKLYIISKNEYYTNNKNVICIKTTGDKIIDNDRVFDCCKIIKNSLFCIIPLHVIKTSNGITSAVESIFLKKCLIVTKNCGLDEYVEDGVTGFMVKQKDIRSYKEKILYLLNDKNRKRMENNIDNSFSESMTWEGFINIVLRKLNDSYNDIESMDTYENTIQRIEFNQKKFNKSYYNKLRKL